MTDVMSADHPGPALLTVPDPAHRPSLLLPVPELPGPDDAGVPRLVLAFRPVAGEIVAEAFTTRARLVDACGPAQPWVASSVVDSITLVADAGASVLVVDPGIQGEAVGIDLTFLASGGGGAPR